MNDFVFLWLKCIINWILVTLRLRKPTLLVFTGSFGSGKSSAARLINTLPGAVGWIESSDDIFSEIFFQHVPQKPNCCRHILYSVVLPKTLAALSFAQRKFFRPHLIGLDRLSLDNLAFSYAFNFPEPPEHLKFCQQIESQLQYKFNFRIFFYEFATAKLQQEALTDRLTKTLMPHEKIVRECEVKEFDWMYIRELNLVLRHFYRACTYPVKTIQQVVRTSNDDSELQENLIKLLLDVF